MIHRCVCLLLLPADDAWSCPESSAMSAERHQGCEALYQRSGELQQRGTISFQHPGQDRTGLEMGLPSRDASLSLCGGGQKHELVCVCTNVSLCVSQCLVYEHNALLFGCAPSVPTLQPYTSIPLSPLIRGHLLYFNILPFFVICFMGFTVALKCSESVIFTE